MSFGQIIAAQLSDPFRIMLLIGLVITMMRTRASTGVVVPLLAGVVFVAVLIPSSMAAHAPEPFWQLVLAGLISNAVWLAAILAIWEGLRRLRRG